MRITVAGDDNTAAAVEGAAELAMDRLPAGEFRLKVDAAGNAKLSGDCKALLVDLHGAGAARVAGSCDTLKATLREASKLDGFDLKTREATVSCTGAARATVHVAELLTAEAKDAGNIEYRGPAKIVSATSGAGRVAGRRE